MHTAKAWGFTPSGFRALSLADRAEMIAHEQDWDHMMEWEEALKAEKIDEQGRS